MMNEQQQNRMIENTTKLTFSIFSTLSMNLTTSTPPPVRTRGVVNAIYIAGIAFMVGVFLILLWVNLFSRYCWCWHDTSVSNIYNRQWFIKRSMMPRNDSTSSKHRQQRQPSMEDEIE